MPKPKHRCEYKHDRFNYYHLHNSYGYDSTTTGELDQCWMTDIGIFLDGDRQTYRCVLHAPADQEPLDRNDWPLSSRSNRQSLTLKEILKSWNEENARFSTPRTLALPGIRCGSIEISKDLGFDKILGAIDFTESTFCGETSFVGIEFLEICSFFESKFVGTVDSSKSIFKKLVTFSRCNFLDCTSFNNSDFKGISSFYKTKFVGHSDFSGANFHEATSFDNSMFADTSTFEGATFFDVATFDKSNFYDHTSFKLVKFKWSSSFNSSIFYGNVEFIRINSDMDITMENTALLGNTRIIYCYFSRPLFITNCLIHKLHYKTHSGSFISLSKCILVDIKNGVVFDPISNDEQIGLLNSSGEKLDITSSGCSLEFKDQTSRLFSFREMDLSKANFMGADIKGARFISCWWESKRISGYKRPYLDTIHSRAYWDGNIEKLRGIEALCRQMRSVLEEDKHFAQAGDFHYHEMEARRHILKQAKGKRPERFILWWYWVTSDYGESFMKLLGWMLGSFVGATGLLVLIEKVFSSKDTEPVASEFWEWLGTTWVALVPSGVQKSIHTENLVLGSKALIGFEALLLVILTTLFVMALRRRFRR